MMKINIFNKNKVSYRESQKNRRLGDFDDDEREEDD